MGLFSAIGDALSGIWKGIKKVFGKIMKPIAKALDSKLGKALMLAVSVFSMGTALLAGVQGFGAAAGQGFIGQFVNGGKAFLNSLLGTKFETIGKEGAAGAAAGAGEAAAAGAENAVQAGDILTGADPTAVGAESGLLSQAAEASGEAAATAPALTDPNAVAKMVSPGGSGIPGVTPGAPAGGAAGITKGAQNVAQQSAEKGWLSKAADAALDFVKSDTGQTVIGSAIQGAGAGAREKEWMEHQRRVERMFEDPNDPGMGLLREHDYNVDVPTGLAAAPGRFSQSEAQRTGRYTPNIPFRRPAPTPTG